jgi:hypothetical protein
VGSAGGTGFTQTIYTMVDFDRMHDPVADKAYPKSAPLKE